jgi:hypothetical protein
MVSNQRNLVIAIQILDLLEACPKLEKDSAKTLRENFLIPLFQTIVNFYPFVWVKSQHPTNKVPHEFARYLLKNFFKESKFSLFYGICVSEALASVFFQLRKVK